MALISCPECSKEISDKASSCPNCGFPIADHLKEQSQSSDECIHCGTPVGPDDEYCPNCGLEQDGENEERTGLMGNERPRTLAVEQMICPFCGKFNEKGSMYCGFCGKVIDPNEIQRRIQYENLLLKKSQLEVQERQLAEQERAQIQQAMQYESMAKCPRCGSTTLSGSKKGFGVGKAVIGVAIAGPLGAIAGNINAKKVRVTCLKCGKRFWA